MNFFHALVLGIVEGLTEYLPVSSTGHLILISKLMNLAPSAFLSTFEIAIQLGAIAAVIVTYRKPQYLNVAVAKRVLAAFIPTALLGLLVYKAVKGLMGSAWVVLVSLFLGGICLSGCERFYKERRGAVADIHSIGSRQAALIGICQCAAFVPGVSRAAATIVAGLVMGLKRETLGEVSFLLAVPTMLAATALDLLKFEGSIAPAEWFYLAAGFITSFLVALAAIRLFVGYVRTHRFTAFGVYRILAAVLFWYLV